MEQLIDEEERNERDDQKDEFSPTQPVFLSQKAELLQDSLQ